jgi:hypothetical protein
MTKHRNRIQSIVALLTITVLFFTSCEELEYNYSGPALVSFSDGTTGSFFVENTANSVDSIAVGVTTLSGSERTINISVDAASTAVQGTHFTLESTTAVIPANSVIGYVVVKGIYSGFTDPMDFKTLILNIDDSDGVGIANFDAQYVLTLSQYSVLTPWLGTYSVAAASYGNPGAWDESWIVNTSADPTDENNIIMTGIGGSANPITATLDVDAGTISIPMGQDLGDPYGWTNLTIQKGTVELVAVNEPVTGTINSDGSMNLDFWAHVATADGVSVWDVFNTSWTKQ